LKTAILGARLQFLSPKKQLPIPAGWSRRARDAWTIARERTWPCCIMEDTAAAATAPKTKLQPAIISKLKSSM
jgi:hypothetical protein